MTDHTTTSWPTLEAFERALGREAHNLSRKPELLWQQLYNRLQWEDKAVRAILERERTERDVGATGPWMRARTLFRESPALLRTLAGASAGCAVSADGAYVVAGSREGLKLWDPSSGQELRSFTGHTNWVQDCAVSPDGAYVVSASNDNTLKLWDPLTGQQLHTLTGHTKSVLACAVSPDGAYVVSSSADHTLKLWDPTTGQELRTLAGHTKEVSTCAFSPDGAYVVSASSDGTVKLWDPSTGIELRNLVGASPCAVSPDGAYVVSGGRDSTLKLWDPYTGRELRTLAGHTDHVRCCVVSPDGAYIVSASQDQTLKLWDPTTGNELRTLEGHAGVVTHCAVSPDGAYVVSSGGDHTVKLWDPSTAREQRTLARHTSQVAGCAVSPDGAYVVSASLDGTLKLWDVATGQALRTLAGHKGQVQGCAITPDGAYVVSASVDNTLKLWDPSTGLELRTLVGGSPPCAISPDGAYIVSPGLDDTLRLWDLSTWQTIRTVTGYPGVVRGCAISSDGAYVLLADQDGTLKLWEPATSKEVETLAGHSGPVWGCAVSPDGAYVASASYDKTLKLWDPSTGQELRTLTGHTEQVRGCAVTPDGAYVVSTGDDGTLKLWVQATGVELVSLSLAGPLACVAVHPWQPVVACGDNGGSLHLIELVDIEYGPIVVTGLDSGRGPSLRCPACFHQHRLDESWLGQDIDCPTDGCQLLLRVNPLVAGHAGSPDDHSRIPLAKTRGQSTGAPRVEPDSTLQAAADEGLPAAGDHRSHLARQRGLRQLLSADLGVPASKLPAGVFGFIAAWMVEALPEVELFADKRGTAVVEVHKLRDGDIQLIVYLSERTQRQLHAGGHVVALPEPSADAREVVSIPMSRVRQVNWSEVSGHYSFELSLSAARGIGSATQLRQSRGLRAVQRHEQDVPVSDLPSGVYGYTVPWLVDHLPHMRLSSARGGTAVVEIHKVAKDDVQLIGYISAKGEARMRRRQPFTVFEQASDDANLLVAIPVRVLTDVKGDPFDDSGLDVFEGFEVRLGIRTSAAELMGRSDEGTSRASRLRAWLRR